MCSKITHLNYYHISPKSHWVYEYFEYYVAEGDAKENAKTIPYNLSSWASYGASIVHIFGENRPCYNKTRLYFALRWARIQLLNNNRHSMIDLLLFYYGFAPDKKFVCPYLCIQGTKLKWLGFEGWGVLKLHLLISLWRKVLIFENIWNVRSFESCSYLSCVAAAKLPQHLTNLNTIYHR